MFWGIGLDINVCNHLKPRPTPGFYGVRLDTEIPANNTGKDRDAVNKYELCPDRDSNPWTQDSVSDALPTELQRTPPRMLKKLTSFCKWSKFMSRR